MGARGEILAFLRRRGPRHPHHRVFRGDLRLHLGYLADPDAHDTVEDPALARQCLCRVLPRHPLAVQLMFIFYGLPAVGIVFPEVSFIPDFSRFAAGIVAMSLNSAAYVSEVVRAGIQAVDKGQAEAARSIGLTNIQTMRIVVLPQAIRNILPALGNEFITVIKESSIVSVIGIGDLMFRTNDVIAVTYKTLPGLGIALIIYFILTFTFGRLVNFTEKKLKYESGEKHPAQVTDPDEDVASGLGEGADSGK